MTFGRGYTDTGVRRHSIAASATITIPPTAAVIAIGVTVAAIPWIDEFYDLAARFPQETGFKITKVEIVPLRNKERYQARMVIQGVAPAGKEQLVNHFIASMRDPHLLARVERLQAGSYKIQVDISRQAAGAYLTRLYLPYVPPSSKKIAQAGEKNALTTSVEQGGGP